MRRAGDRASPRRSNRRRCPAWPSSRWEPGVPAACPAPAPSCDRVPVAPPPPPAARGLSLRGAKRSVEPGIACARSFPTFGFLAVVVGDAFALVRLGRLIELAGRHHAEHHTAPGQVLVGHTLDVVSRDRQRFLVVGPESTGIAV